jgi:lysocardiolipin and lysophospholipid acyltransferase
MRESRKPIQLPDTILTMPALGNTHLLTPARRGKFGEQYFTLSGTYFEGRPPKSVNFYWRRFRVADIPLEDAASFELWLRDRWYEKDALMEQYISTGRFPASPGGKGESQGEGQEVSFVETEVRTKFWWEFTQIFIVLAIFGLAGNVVSKAWASFLHCGS